MDEKTRIENARDLKIYKGIIAIVFIISIIIAMVVGIVTTDNYVVEAKTTNGLINLLMPDSITGGAEADHVSGMTFYREKNKDYNPIKDEPISAFNYYYKTDEGKRIDLENGVFYPADFYNEAKKGQVQPVYVFAGFYFKAYENWKVVKRVVGTVITLVCLAIVGVFIYLWYLSWCKREDAKKELRKQAQSK